jgi:hypothetical protein
MELSADHRFQDLRRLPDYTANRLFELHYELQSYPSYALFATPLHCGLVAKMRQVQGQPRGKQIHVLGNYLTAPKRIVPAFPEAWVRPRLQEYDAEELKSYLWDVAAKLTKRDGTPLLRVTQADYVDKFMDIIHAAARDRPFQPRPWHQRLQKIDLAIEEEVEFEDRLDQDPHHQAWLARAQAEAWEIGEIAPPLDEHTLEDEAEEPDAAESTELEGLSAPDARRVARYVRYLWVLRRSYDLAAPGVIPLSELCFAYAGIQQSSEAEPELNRLVRHILLDSLIHLGRPAAWLASVQVGSRPKSPTACPQPVYDPVCASIFYVPDMFLAYRSGSCHRQAMALKLTTNVSLNGRRPGLNTSDPTSQSNWSTRCR